MNLSDSFFVKISETPNICEHENFPFLNHILLHNCLNFQHLCWQKLSWIFNFWGLAKKKKSRLKNKGQLDFQPPPKESLISYFSIKKNMVTIYLVFWLLFEIGTVNIYNLQVCTTWTCNFVILFYKQKITSYKQLTLCNAFRRHYFNSAMIVLSFSSRAPQNSPTFSSFL